MKRRFYLSFKIFLILFIGFVVVLGFEYYQGVNRYIGNMLSGYKFDNYITTKDIQDEYQKASSIDDPIFKQYVDNSATNGLYMYTVIADKNLKSIYQRSEHIEELSGLYLSDEVKQYDIDISTFSKEQRDTIINTLRKYGKNTKFEIDGQKTLSKSYSLKPNGEEVLLPEEEQNFKVIPTYLKVENEVIVGKGTNTTIKGLTFNYYDDKYYNVQPYYDNERMIITNNKLDIETQIPGVLDDIKQHDIHMSNATSFHYSKVDNKYYQWVLIPLYTVDETKEWSMQEIEGYYLKVKYAPTVQQEAKDMYVDDNIGTYALSLTIIVIISIICSYMIVKPIKKIDKVAKQIANNDFDVTLSIKHRDELGSLSNSINTMSTNLKETIDKLRDEIEQVKRLEVMRKEFIANFTHEIKTPLAIINGYSELIEETKDEQEIEKYVHIIDEETKKINRLVYAMLNLSKLESNLVILKIESIDIEDMVTKVIDSYEVLLKEKEVLIDFKSTTPTIDGDREQLETVITNFMSNAMYHVNIGGKIYITIDEHMFSIENEGPIIEEQRLVSIWDTFQTGNKQGTGLGLSICRSILELHQYEYGVENTDKGVKFYFKY